MTVNDPGEAGSPGKAYAFVSKNKAICKRLSIRNVGMAVEVTTRKTGVRVMFAALLLVLIGVIAFLGSQDVFGNMDARGMWMFGIMTVGPIVGVGVFYAFPGQCLVANKGARTIECQNRWLTFPIRRKVIRENECASLSVAVLGKEVTERVGLNVGSTLLGVAAEAALGVGWVHYKTATRNVPVYGILISTHDGVTVLTHLTWSGEDCDRAVRAIWALFPNIPGSALA